MKNISLTIILVGLMLPVLNAQTTSFFNQDVIYYESNFINELILPVKVDSTLYQDGDSTLYLQEGMISHYSYDCMDTAGINMLGPKITKKADGNYLFYNQFNDTIPIYMDREQGEEWICYTDATITVKAVVESIYSGTFNNDGDIVHKFRFNVIQYDSTYLFKTVDNHTIKIGEKYGLLTAIPWVAFPEIPEYFYPRNRVSADDFINGTYPTYEEVVEVCEADIYNFQVGDQFHIKYYYWDETPHLKDVTLTKYTVLSREENTDTLKITYRREKQTGLDSVGFDSLLNGTYYYFYNDVSVNTITKSYSKNNYEYSKPYYFTIYGTNALTTDHERPAYFTSYLPIWSAKDSCAHWDEFFYNDENKYIKGLGGPFYYNTGNSYNEYTESRELKFFNLQDGSTYGEPIEFVGMKEHPENQSFSIYPNPAKKSFYISLDQNTVNGNIIISDLHGQTIISKNFSPVEPVKKFDINKLKAGIYIVSVRSKNQILGVRKLIVR